MNSQLSNLLSSISAGCIVNKDKELQLIDFLTELNANKEITSNKNIIACEDINTTELDLQKIIKSVSEQIPQFYNESNVYLNVVIPYEPTVPSARDYLQTRNQHISLFECFSKTIEKYLLNLQTIFHNIYPFLLINHYKYILTKDILKEDSIYDEIKLIQAIIVLTVKSASINPDINNHFEIQEALKAPPDWYYIRTLMKFRPFKMIVQNMNDYKIHAYNLKNCIFRKYVIFRFYDINNILLHSICDPK
uniref:Uncharacterized protein n=1 Tax=Faxonius propinquus nudivirus TaxID=3139431 RepID=A0AAU8GE56_9VIRU